MVRNIGSRYIHTIKIIDSIDHYNMGLIYDRKKQSVKEYLYKRDRDKVI